MADFVNFTLESLQTAEGLANLNNIINTLNANIVGDTEGLKVYSGYGSPEGVITADVGSLYLRKDGTTDTTLYRKESGTGNTGWVATTNITLPLTLGNGGTGQALSDPNADRVMFWDDSEGKVDWLTAGTGLSITGTTLAVTIAAGYTLVSSGTFTTSNNIQISNTISAGDVYKVVFEATVNSGTNTTFYLRINADGSGSNYHYVTEGYSWDGSTKTDEAETSTGADGFKVNRNVFASAHQNIYLEADITARGSDTQVFLENRIWRTTANTFEKTEVFGYYDAATPTSIDLVGTSGNVTLTGRYYLLKLSQS